MFYFKDNNGGIGIADTQKDIGAVTWITEEEYKEILRAKEG